MGDNVVMEVPVHKDWWEAISRQRRIMFAVRVQKADQEGKSELLVTPSCLTSRFAAAAASSQWRMITTEQPQP